MQTPQKYDHVGQVPFVPLSFSERASDIIAFFRKPQPYGLRHPWSLALVIAVLTVFAIDFVIDSTIILSLAKMDEAAGILPEAVDFEIPIGTEIFASIILAPILEEALFRGWLTGKLAALRFAAMGFVALAVLMVSEYVPAELEILLILVFFALCVTGYVIWSNRRWHDTQVPDWFTPNYHWFVWGSSVLFGFYHVCNFQGYDTPLSLLIVVPYTIGGLFLAYTRTRFGLRAAMLHHALYNAMSLLIYYEVIPWP